ncbi:noncanonical pyrimidine nucleotidase, YjjG family [Muricauda sp. JGD-17]|uniref:Noncanonical pyrimidine nucleotidase, YjjG family n=1 Tax=Flagellimonas ochracea TaxID=2696472 RepID=A0A964TES9_9FLAO|nr:YjjG family noncanonical pyrimidine nucleotidase [Allomuricauda ochracea]NAY92909.1 noncanonical pyrimidine nucleotidase, YjjG family [Allomuricauda ochracea]
MCSDRVTDVFFDLDHTLWDFEKNSALTFRKIFDANQLTIKLDDFLTVYAPINFEFWKLYRENRISKPQLRYQRLKKTFDHLGKVVSDDIIDTLAHDYIAHLSSFTHLIPNATEVLEYLSPKYRLHIITNGFQEVQEKKLKGSKIHHYFEHVVNSETAGVKKPHPYIFELALDKAKTTPQNALMIGDSLEADVQGAKSVGMQAIHFNCNGESSHEVAPMINNLIEIKSFL